MRVVRKCLHTYKMNINGPGPLCEETGLYGEILALDSGAEKAT